MARDVHFPIAGAAMVPCASTVVPMLTLFLVSHQLPAEPRSSMYPLKLKISPPWLLNRAMTPPDWPIAVKQRLTLTL